MKRRKQRDASRRAANPHQRRDPPNAGQRGRGGGRGQRECLATLDHGGAEGCETPEEGCLGWLGWLGQRECLEKLDHGGAAAPAQTLPGLRTTKLHRVCPGGLKICSLGFRI